MTMMMMMRFWMHLLEINISSEKNTPREKQYSFFHFNKKAKKKKKSKTFPFRFSATGLSSPSFVEAQKKGAPNKRRNKTRL